LTFVQDALPVVIVAVVVLAGVVAVAMAFAARGTYEQIGRSDMTFDRADTSSTADAADLAALLESTNARRIARGLEPLDVDAEVERRLRAQDG
jgi:hypothetical protein